MRKCNGCGSQMTDMPEMEAETFLAQSLSQCNQKERQLGSVRFFALRCPKCNSTKVGTRLGSGYSTCGACNCRTEGRTGYISRQATEFLEGCRHVETTCYHCDRRCSWNE